MIYKVKSGRIKDGCMIYEKGVFYLFSMYHKENSDKFNNVWLATSRDGVHFEDYGCVVEDFSEFIWAMKVYRGEDAFYMNSGSFSASGKQTVLKFWKSYNLVNWEYCPELDVEAPNSEDKSARLDCMNVIKFEGKYYGYATGQYGYLESDDGAVWKAMLSKIDYTQFPEYNRALGGFEIADFIEFDKKFYLFCGGFGHLGMSGYGVYVYESDSPDGVFKPCLPNYRINGTSKRWVNMWERFFEKDGVCLAHNYMYDGYSYESGNVYLPPLKKLKKANGLCLEWWDGNDVLYGELLEKCECLTANAKVDNVFSEESMECAFSEKIKIPARAVIEMKMELAENSFVEYSAGGIFLGEDAENGSGIIFDTYGKCEIFHIEDGRICSCEDVIGFGSTAPYYVEDGKSYDLKILVKDGMFEIYVNDLYLQTFNNAHTPGGESKPFSVFSAIARRNRCVLSDAKIYNMDI